MRRPAFKSFWIVGSMVSAESFHFLITLLHTPPQKTIHNSTLPIVLPNKMHTFTTVFTHLKVLQTRDKQQIYSIKSFVIMLDYH